MRCAVTGSLNIIAREYLILNEEQDAIEARHRNGQLAPGDASRLFELWVAKGAALGTFSAREKDKTAWQKRAAKKA